MPENLQHPAFKTIVIFNLLVFLVFLSALYTFFVDEQGEWQGLGTVGFAYMLLAFLAFTSYFYYEFLNKLSPERPRTLMKTIFISNLLVPLALLLFLFSQTKQL